MKKINYMLFITLFGVGISFTSCDKEKDDETKQTFDKGVLISNEGIYGNGDGSISYYSTSEDVVINEIFQTTNDRPLGDVVQSITKHDSKVYICVNVSNKIEVADAISFEELGVINDLTSVRYFVGNNTTGYASIWGNGGQIKVIDLTSMTVTSSIDVGTGPEQMAIINNKLYVANCGEWSLDSTLSVIDLSTNTVSTSINLNAYNPTAIITDSNNDLWVLAKGQIIYNADYTILAHKASKLVKINTTTNTVEKTIDLFDEQHPEKLEISPDATKLYIGAGVGGFNGIFEIGINATTVPSTALLSEICYGFKVNPDNGNIFILTDAGTTNGKLIRYKADGTQLGEYEVGLYPGNGAFKK